MNHSVEPGLEQADFRERWPTETLAGKAKGVFVPPLLQPQAAQLVAPKETLSFHMRRGEGGVKRTLSCISDTSSSKVGQGTSQSHEAPTPGPLSDDISEDTPWARREPVALKGSTPSKQDP